MQILNVWKVQEKHGAKTLRKISCEAAERKGSSMPPYLPEGWTGKRAKRSDTEASSTDIALAQSISDSRASSCVRELLHKAGDGWAAFDSLENVSMDEITALTRHGAVETSLSEFDEVLVRPKNDGLRWVSNIVIAEPQLMYISHALVPESKLDLMISLQRQGWVTAKEIKEAWNEGDPLVCVFDSRRPISYYQCLLRRSALIAKNVKTILHGAVDAYYLVLLRLSPEAIRRALEAGEKTNDWFRKQLKNKSEDNANYNIDMNVSSDDDGTQHVLEIEEGTTMMPGILDGVSSVITWKRCSACMVDGQDPPQKIYIDTKHHSGRDRGYIACSKHVDCGKYVFCDHFKFRSDMVEWLYAWSKLWAACETKEAHIEVTPSDADTQEIAGKLHIAEF